MVILAVFGVLEAPQDAEFRAAVITQLFRFSQLLVFFWIAYRLLMFEGVVRSTLLTLAASCVLLAVLQTAGVVTTETGRAGLERISTFGDNPNIVAAILGAGLLCLVGLAYGRQDMTLKLRILAWLTSGFLLIGIVRTGSRGSLLALVLALIALTVRPSVIAERMKIMLIALLMIVVLAVASYQIDAVRERWEMTYFDRDAAGRQVLLPAAWEMFLEKPTLGWGPVSHAYEMAVRSRKPMGDPHNLYLWILIETGLVGAIPFFLGLWLCWLGVWRARHGPQGSLPLALFLFVLVINLKGTYLYVKLFWIVMAYALATGSYAIVSARQYFRPFPIVAKVPRSQALAGRSFRNLRRL
jgi:O-antigen ligase